MNTESSSLDPLLGHPLLTAKEQHRLGVQMRIYYRTARRLQRRLGKRGPRRFLPEAIAIAKRRGDELRNTLVTSCLRWVAKIARRYMYNPWRLTFDELMSHGYCGLLRATQRWKPSRGKLLTYATFWIRHSIRRAAGYDYKPLEFRYVTHRTDPELLAEIARDGRPDGIEKFIEADERQTKVDFVRRCLVELPDQHANIIRLRYLRGRKQTLEEVGGRINLTRERVRQLEDDALGRLSKHVRTPNQNWSRRGCPAVVPDVEAFQTYQQRFEPLES